MFSTLFLVGSAIAALQTFSGLATAIGTVIVIAGGLALASEQLLGLLVLLAAIVVAIGCVTLPTWLRLPIDLSYGVYLYAFPMQQVSAMLFADFWMALAFSILTAFGLAWLSATFVERPALRLKAKQWLKEWPPATLRLDHQRNARPMADGTLE
jgi:peptidoglycan/LPS O-acetylase OafA/YrhL